MTIDIQLRDKRWSKALRGYRKITNDSCGAALAAMKRKHGEIAVVLASDAFIRKLNRDFRGKDKPTNVLSFPYGDGDQLGDIVLAYETIAREAKAQGKTFKAHATHMLVHGTLHLLGHDHMREKEAARMEALEIQILEKLDISNPYL